MSNSATTRPYACRRTRPPLLSGYVAGVMLGTIVFAFAIGAVYGTIASTSLVVAKGSGHYVQLEQPALVGSAVKQVVAAAGARP